MKVKIYWATRNWALIRRIREKYHLPQCMDVTDLPMPMSMRKP